MLNILGTSEDLELFNKEGVKLYHFETCKNGVIRECTWDKWSQTLTSKDSRGFLCLYTRDEKGKQLAYKNSDGYYIVKGKKVTKEEYEAFIEELENPTKEYTYEELETILGHKFKIKQSC